MNHEEAVQELATERYLLDELSPELRDAFEEHMFECMECAFDVRSGNVFLTEAKVQLPNIDAPALQSKTDPKAAARAARKPWWSTWTPVFRPAFAMPAFAVLLGVIAFQNVATIPSLRTEATEPRIAPLTALHTGTRGTEPTVVHANKDGAEILIELPQQGAYSSFSIDLYDPHGRQLWTRTVPATADSNAGTLSLTISSAGLEQGAYTLNLAGISPQGDRTELGRRTLDVHIDD